MCASRGFVASQMSREVLHVVRTDRKLPSGRSGSHARRPLRPSSPRSLFASAPHAARSVRARSYVAPAGSGALFLVSGHGYGHGVGMGQWGAQGYAQQGYTYDQILAAYYPGTTLGQTTTTSIRVLLASGKKKLTISSKKPITVEDGDGVDHTLPAGKTTLTPALKLAVDGGPAQALDPPLTFSPAAGRRSRSAARYRGPDPRRRAEQEAPRDQRPRRSQQYLYGVVPAEMPSSLASRSARGAGRRRALVRPREPAGRARRSTSTPTGAARRTSASRPRRRPGGRPWTRRPARCSSTTATWPTRSSPRAPAAGRSRRPTRSARPGRPYLVSVRDPYDTISPYHDWGPVPVTGKTLGKRARRRRAASSTRPSSATRRAA